MFIPPCKLCNILIESFPKNIEFLVKVDVDLEEGVTGSQMAIQVISTEELDFEDSLFEKLDNILEKKAVGGAVRWALIINDHITADVMLH